MGEASVGRRKGGLYASISPHQGLVAYQSAVREQLEAYEALPEGQYSVTFYLWRQQATYISESNRRVQKHQADATNMQKALEDALQKMMFDNDRDVQDIRTRIVEQGPNVNPRVVIRLDLLEPFNPDEIPDHVWTKLDELGKVRTAQSEFDYEGTDVDF